jgi:hypothetical protein
VYIGIKSSRGELEVSGVDGVGVGGKERVGHVGGIVSDSEGSFSSRETGGCEVFILLGLQQIRLKEDCIR